MRIIAEHNVLRCIGLGGFLAIAAVAVAEPIPRTSLENRLVRYTVLEKPYVVLKRGDLEAVVVDNRAVDDAVLPGHRAGYSGLASLRHARQSRNLFVPSYAGLNFEHVIDGSTQNRTVLFEPRNFPMQLRVIDEHTAELYQAPTPHYGVESCQRFELRADGVLEMTFECIPRRKTWAHDYLLFFWASYIDRPESLDIHFLGQTDGESGAPRWIRGVTPQHGVNATHRARDDRREPAHVEPFPLELPFGYSAHRYTEPWYYGVCRGMAFAQAFRARDQIRLVQSPSGGGNGCPAWDFQWMVPDCRVDQRYQMVMRALYTPWPAASDETAAREILRQQVKEVAAFQTASFSAEAVARRAFGGVQPVVSPDGMTVALSFQGSIARMPAAGGTLTRLTRASGWDIEPAWSPDGQRIAFINTENFGHGPLRIIAAEDGAPVSLPNAVTARGRLQFHPDSRRLLGLFVRSGFPESLHWCDLASGELTRLPIDSLDPVHHARMKWTLSPDGETILFTKNADVPGEQDGSQGASTELWRVSSEGGAPQLITRWPARIYWLCSDPGMDACFIVTDRGGALNDVWHLPLEDTLAGARKITFGQADEDRPSVSADGKWLVHSENSERATALVRIELAAGRRESPSIDGIDFREPTGRLRVEIRDAESGEPITARVSVAQPNGKSHFPLGALYRIIWGKGSYYGWDDELELPAGRCTIEASHGPEYVVGHAETEIIPGQTYVATMRLARWVNMPERGWFSGENHIHANYGVGSWHCDQQTVRDQCEGEDLHVGNIMVANSNGDGVFDREFFLGQPDPMSKPRTILYWNEEFRSTIWGHLTLGNLGQLVEPIFTGFKETTNPWDVPTNADIAERTRAQGGTVSYTHPAMEMLDLYRSAYSGKGLPVDAALGRVDTMDVMGGGYRESLVLWYSLLNCGFRIPAAAGTDVFLNRIVSNPPGWGRAYINLGKRLTYDAWIRGQRAGRSFITSGPMLEMTAGTLVPGDSLNLDAPGEVKLHARAWAHHSLDALEIVVNGRVVQTIQPAADGREAVFDGTIPLDRSGWLAVRCAAENRGKAAHMNPIWVEIRGHPAEANSDAEYLLKWIDRLESDLRQRGRLPGPALDHAMKQLNTARAVYRKQVSR